MRLINILSVFFIISVFIGCVQQSDKNTFDLQPQKIFDFEVDKSTLNLVPSKGQWFFNDVPFNGYAIKKHQNGVTVERFGYYNGKKEGIAKKFFDSGALHKEMLYIQNKLHGTSYTYYPDGSLYEESNYTYGKRNGVQKTWYANGQLAKQRNLVDGKEEGMQQAWLENGKIYVNYEVKNGRIFGMNRANLCYQLKEEKIEYAKDK